MVLASEFGKPQTEEEEKTVNLRPGWPNWLGKIISINIIYIYIFLLSSSAQEDQTVSEKGLCKMPFLSRTLEFLQYPYVVTSALTFCPQKKPAVKLSQTTREKEKINLGSYIIKYVTRLIYSQ